MPIDLSGRVIAITGASSGIGAATAVACGQAGMRVVLAARRLERLRQVAHEVEAAGGKALALACDVTDEPQVKKLVQDAIAHFGDLHIMFANAGYGLYCPVLETTDQQFRDIFQVNFMGTIYALRAAAAVMRPRRSGHLVICTSAASEISPPMYGAYGATKAAQDAIACSLRAELADEGILVTSVHPIPTTTEFFDRMRETATQGRAVVSSPAPVSQTPQVVARRIVAALRRPRPEVWPHLPTRFGAAIATAFPGLPSHFLAAHMRKLHALEPAALKEAT